MNHQTLISKTFSVYILQSLADGTYYAGFSNDVKRRLIEHNSGKSKYTKGHRPYKIIYIEECKTRKEAKGREMYIKKYGNIYSFLKSRVPPN